MSSTVWKSSCAAPVAHTEIVPPKAVQLHTPHIYGCGCGSDLRSNTLSWLPLSTGVLVGRAALATGSITHAVWRVAAAVATGSATGCCHIALTYSTHTVQPD